MKKLIFVLAIFLVLSCQKTKNDKIIYASDAFTVYADKIVQGKNVATVISPTEIRSNYRSPASETFSRLVVFKFSINEKDNELPPGQDHWVVIGDEKESPVVVFGEKPQPQPEKPNTHLPVNFEYTIRVDMSSVLKQFETKGYYEAYDGTKVAKSDFKGFFIAGSSEPLSWDFVNLSNKGLKLKPTSDPNIFSITIKFNPFNEAANQEKTWKLERDLSSRAKYQSQQPIVDALFNLSLEEATKNIEADSTFRTGAKWGGVWTRDISYSIVLAFAYHEPKVAMTSLRKKVKRNRIIQDTGSGGAWPVSSDRTTWVLAAWEIYKATGDQNWLNEIYPIIKNTLDDDYKTLFDNETGMYSGESSFLDWREQTYPKWMSNMDIYVSENLGTNVVHYQAHKILAEIAKLKGESGEVYSQRAKEIKSGINQFLWMNDKGYYAQYLYGRPSLMISPRFEALGEALAVLFGVADEKNAAAIISKSPVTDFGVTCIYPQIPGIPPYHNNGIWPFVQSYWNLAAAKTGNEKVLTHGLAAIYRAAGLFLTNYENMVAQTGDFLGTEINSDRMLWSMAGNLAMVHRVFMGMSFELDGLHFNPVVPKSFKGTKTLSNFKYRNSVLNITVNGYGNQIRSMVMDGNEMKGNFIPTNLTGVHSISIDLADNDFGDAEMNKVENHFSPTAPQPIIEGNSIRWQIQKWTSAYNIYKDGVLINSIMASEYKIPDEKFSVYQVSAVDEKGFESFASAPLNYADKPQFFELENFAAKASRPYSNFSGKGFVEISTDKNKIIEGTMTVDKAGVYLLDVRYSNGSGPWNTDNKCAIRTLSINGNEQGVLVFPQRGKDEWSDWGFSNSRKVKLNAGANKFKISFEEWNNNMNVDVNTAELDYIRLIPMN